MRGYCLRLGLLGITALLGACASRPAGTPTPAPPQLIIRSGHMPMWKERQFGAAETCDQGIFISGHTYRNAVLAAREHDRIALEEVIECSYSPNARDGEAARKHAGVLQQLLFAWGDIDFSRSLLAVKNRHGGQIPPCIFEIQYPEMRRFFPLTATVLYGAPIL